MRTFTKLCFLVFALTFSATLFAQQNIYNHVGAKAIDKMEMIQQLHGSAVVVPHAPEGTTRALGDDCTDPIIIEQLDLPFTDANQTTAGRGNNYDNTCLNDFDGGEDIIYELQLTDAMTIHVSIDPKGTPRTGVAISDGCPLTSTCLAISYDLYNGGVDPHGFTVTLEAGYYYIMVDTWPNPTSIADFDLMVEEVATVANDDCSDATPIGEVINLSFSTVLATNDFGGASGPNIWFDYTAGFTGEAVIDLCGSDYDTWVGAWEGPSCPIDFTTYIDENDDACGYDGLQSKLIINVIEGNVYKLEVGGFNGATGEGLLSIYENEVCTLTCPPGGVDENEPCGTDVNGGCTMDVPAFTTVTGGTTICGNLWSEFGTRDTDWFELVLTTPGSIKMTVETEETVIFGLVGQQELGIPGCNNVTNFLSAFEILPACQEDFVQVVYLPKGTYYFFVAPMDYFAHPCPGFNYLATFETEELESGFISGVVLNSDGGSPIQGVKVTAGDYSVTTNATGNYLLELPTGTYDVTANGYEVGFSTETTPGVAVTDGDITNVNFLLDALPAPVLLSAVPDIEEVALEWEPIGAKAEGGKTLMGDIVSNNDYVPGATMDLDFTMTIFSPDFEWGEYAEVVFPGEFNLLTATDLNGIAAVIDGQKVSWSGLFYTDDLPAEIDFTVEVEVDPLAEGPLVVDYYVEGDGFGLDPHYFEGAFTIYEDGGTYVPTFNVYRKLGPIGNNNTFIPIAFGVIGNNYVDVIPPGGEEWCYLVKQVLEDKSLSPASNAICVVPLVIPGSTCEDALLYSVVNDPAYPESLVREEDERWFEFEVPYTMDVAIALTYAEFDPSVELYADCDGTLVEAEEFCGGMDYDLEQAYQFLPGGTYYARVSSLSGFGDFEIYISQIQVLTIREGWSGFSTYMDPAGDLDIASQLDCLAEDMVITVRQNPYGIWWPSQNLNTIGDIYNTFGYKAKMDVERTTIIYGTETADKTVALPFGSSYLPVRVSAPTPSTDILAQLTGEMLLVYDINEPSNVIWPDGGLNTLDFLVPGHAYLINMFVASSYTYPMPTMAPVPNFVEPPAMAKSSVWNEVVNTGNPHFISIHEDALTSIETGDIIGVFDADGKCVGISEYIANDGNLFMPAFGNDELTESKDGLLEGEKMTYKLYRGSSNTVYEVEVTYSEDMPNADGLYELHGMSMIVELKVGSTSVFDAQLSAISVYPNPTNGMLNIAGLDKEVEVTVTNIHGQVISRDIVSENTTLDLSTQPGGVYFIKMMTENATRIEKIVLR